MKDLAPQRVSLGVLVALFVVLSFALAAGGYLHYQREAKVIEAQRYTELRTIAGLKIDQIVTWRNERLSDVRFSSAQPALRQAVERWVARPGGASLREEILQNLALIRDFHEYQNVALLGLDGRILITLDPRMTDAEIEVQTLADRAIQEGRPVLGEFFRCADSRDVHLDVAAPVLDARGQPVALLLLRSDPESLLYPLVQSWPAPSETAETLLVRREGENVLFLNRLRHRQGPALAFSQLLSRADLPAAQVVLGRTGRFRGIDYRGVQVLADLRPVPGSPWFMIAKVDEKEILAEIGYRGGVIMGFLGLGMLLIATLLGFLFYFGQANLYGAMVRSMGSLGTREPTLLQGSASLARKTVMVVALLAMSVGSLVLVGWAFDLPAFKSLVPVFVSMKANTAAGFVLSGGALLLAARPAIPQRWARSSAILVALLGGFTLLQYLLGVDLGLDQLLFREPNGMVGTLSPGRMAPVTALGFLVFGGALLLSAFPRVLPVSQGLSFLTVLIGLLPALGYFYGAPGLFGLGHYTQMALHTAVTFVLLGLGGLLLRPEAGPIRLIASDSPAGMLLRRLLPFLVGAPLLLGYLWVTGERWRYFEGPLGASLMMVVLIVCLLGLVWWTAQALNRIDAIRNQAEARARESAEEIRATLYSIGDGVIAADCTGQVVHMNPVAERLTGWREGEAFGKPLGEVFRIVSEETLDAVESPVARVLRTGQVIGMGNHTLLIAKDGTQRPIADSGAPVLDHQGDIARVVLVFRDQTTARSAERALEVSEAKHRRLHESLWDAYVLVAMDGRILESNQPYLKMLGYSKEELAHLTYEDLTPPEWHAMEARIVRDEVLPSGYSRIYEKTYRRKDGSVFPVELRTNLLVDDQGRPSGMWAIIRDISARKLAEKSLLESEVHANATARMLEGLIDAIPDVIGIQDAAQRILRYNAAGYALLGTTPEQANGRKCYEIIGRTNPCEVCATQEARVTKRPSRREKFVPELNLWLDARSYPILDEQGELAFIIEHLRDISEQKAKEEQIKTAQAELQRLLAAADRSRNALLSLLEDQQFSEDEIRRLNADLERRVATRTAELESANKELEAFAYSVSHDLRAPLRHMDGFLSMLARQLGEGLDGKSAHYLAIAQGAARRMGQLVDGLLAFSRLGRAELHAVPVDSAQVVSSVIDEFRNEYAEREIRWKLGALPTLHGDPTLIRLVLQNLVGNALKFTRGRPETVIEIQPIEGLTSETGILVRDNGAGYDPAYGHKLFGVFQRLHREEEFEGTGIGLANVQRIVSRHGGRVWAEGRLGQGASFFFTFPDQGRQS